MLRYIASCVVLALVASSAHGVVVSNSSQTTVYTVANNDLLQTNLSGIASTLSFSNFGVGGLAVLTDGSGGAATTANFPTSAIPSNNATVTYSLNIAQFPQGYNLTSIDTYGEWDDGRDRQDVSISFSTVANPGVFTTLSTYSFEPPGPAPNFSRVRVTPDAGQTFLAEGVAAVRFSFPNQENAGGGYRELDVLGAGIGTPTFVPVPLQNATAFGSQTGFAVGNLLDKNIATGWAGDLNQANLTPANTAVFETVTDVEGPGKLNFDFASGGQFAGHTVGRFRISVTGDDRSTFADGFANFGDVEANWTVVDLDTILSDNPTTILTELADGSVLASGGIGGLERYTVSGNSPLGRITGIRLEMLEDPSLPTVVGTGGPGRAFNGNFVIFDFNATFTAASAIPEPATAVLAMFGVAGLLFRRRRVA